MLSSEYYTGGFSAHLSIKTDSGQKAELKSKESQCIMLMQLRNSVRVFQNLSQYSVQSQFDENVTTKLKILFAIKVIKLILAKTQKKKPEFVASCVILIILNRIVIVPFSQRFESEWRSQVLGRQQREAMHCLMSRVSRRYVTQVPQNNTNV